MLYGLIQALDSLHLYTMGGNITDYQFIYMDLTCLIPLSIVMCWTEAAPTLTKDIPTSSLFYFPVLLSVCYSIAV
jgi:cation-transporting ATPase 13A3/4/5